jgi:hypothetical protein
MPTIYSPTGTPYGGSEYKTPTSAKIERSAILILQQAEMPKSEVSKG